MEQAVVEREAALADKKLDRILENYKLKFAERAGEVLGRYDERRPRRRQHGKGDE